MDVSFWLFLAQGHRDHFCRVCGGPHVLQGIELGQLSTRQVPSLLYHPAGCKDGFFEGEGQYQREPGAGPLPVIPNNKARGFNAQSWGMGWCSGPAVLGWGAATPTGTWCWCGVGGHKVLGLDCVHTRTELSPSLP